MAAKFLQQSDLAAWLQELAGDYRTLVPRREADAVVFRPFDPHLEVELDRQATMPPKAAVFPQSEPLLTYEYVKDPEHPAKVSVQVQERRDESHTLVFGCRPCDARGFTVFDPVYNSENVKDLNYLARRENTSFIALTCKKPATTCFCHWTGGGPADTAGTDALMTPVEGGWVLEAVSDKGEKLLSCKLLADAGDKAEKAEAVKKQAAEALGEAPDLSQAPEKLLALFDDMAPAGFWDEMSAKCISCGACTYLCPTCYCFNISDEACGSRGARIRSWDNCMSFLFTMEASGHNPRPTKAHRLKNRVGHKFSYYPRLHQGAIACCGCGRCIKSCPVSVDIRQIVLNALQAEPATQE